jgi:hypothetical protein
MITLNSFLVCQKPAVLCLLWNGCTTGCSLFKMETGAQNSIFERVKHLSLAWHMLTPAHVHPWMPVLGITQNTGFHRTGSYLRAQHTKPFSKLSPFMERKCWFTSSARRIHSNISLRFILILFSHLRHSLPSVRWFDFSNNNVYVSHLSHACYVSRRSRPPWSYHAIIRDEES